ncbi:LysR family transcriptional regulator [Altererythrobacter sp. Root672]|uniref:LysR family transcriptional regulator n=1 Tax=Altererythrobacter sp. Root672 TaxID=1736584 RepID=UPI0006FE018D|nr:LysR family transcriptional regulator [Altererythrobacter sp. Root672]KRA83689.1 hypothetical protein ASD76_06585 [Altererythrobacter sp. Root672]
MAFEKTKEFDWDKVRVFLALIHEGTLSGAARSLRIVPSSVSRNIEDLEHALGSHLFYRTPRGYLPTDAGRALVENAEAAERAMFAFTARGSGHGSSVTGTVRLATAENFATRLILPNVATLLARHPELRLEVVTDVRTVQLSRREADIALRLVRPRSGSYLVSKVAEMESAIFAASDYLLEGPIIDRLVCWDERDADLAAAQWLRKMRPKGKAAVTTTSLASQLAAVKGGAGLGVLPLFMADGLNKVSDEILRQPVWLVRHSDTHRSAPIIAVMQFIRECLGRTSHGFS